MSEIVELYEISDRIYDIARRLDLAQAPVASDPKKLGKKIDKLIEITEKLKDKPSDNILHKFENEVDKFVSDTENIKINRQKNPELEKIEEDIPLIIKKKEKVVSSAQKVLDKPTETNLKKFEKDADKLITEVEQTKKKIDDAKQKIEINDEAAEIVENAMETEFANMVQQLETEPKKTSILKKFVKIKFRLNVLWHHLDNLKEENEDDFEYDEELRDVNRFEDDLKVLTHSNKYEKRLNEIYSEVKDLYDRVKTETDLEEEVTMDDLMHAFNHIVLGDKTEEVQPIDKALSTAQQTKFVPEDLRKMEEDMDRTVKEYKGRQKYTVDTSVIDKMRKEMEEAVTEMIAPADGSCLTRGKKKLQPHQRNFVKAFMENKQSRGALAIHGIGSGKTLTAVATSQCYLDKYPDSKVVVITPASLQANFKQELYEYSPSIKDDKRYVFHTFDSYMNKGGDCKDALLIIDEAHNLRNMTGVKVQEILEGCAVAARKVLLLTATPVVNDNYDIISLMRLINPNLKVFKSHMEYPGEATIKEIFDCRISIFTPNESERHKYFPKVYREAVPLEMSKSYYEKYQDVEDNTMDEETKKLLGRKKKKRNPDFDLINPTAFYNGVRRGANALEAENSPKIKYIMNLIKKGDENKKFNKKFVIFSHFLDAGSKLLIKALDKEGIPFGEINGSMSKSKREEVVNQYVDGAIDVIIISKAGAEGLNLKNTGHLVIMEPAWNETLIDQVIGRAVRFKGHEDSAPAKRNVKIHQLLLLKPEEYEDVLEDGLEGKPRKGNSIDMYLFKFSLQKQKQIDEFLEDLKKYAKQIDDPSCKVPRKDGEEKFDLKQLREDKITELRAITIHGTKKQQEAAQKKLDKLELEERYREIRKNKRKGKNKKSEE